MNIPRVMTLLRASAFSVRVPIEAAFSMMVAPRLEMTDAAGAVLACAPMTYSIWRRMTASAETVMAARAIGGFRATIELSREEDGMAEDVPAAHGVRVACAPSGAPMIEFLDENGCAFAVAEFTPEVFSQLIGECCDLLELVSKGGLATVPCAGAA